MFANGIYAIWYSDNGYWMIGYSSQQGTRYGFAINRSNYNCPYYPAYDWKYLDYYQNWCPAGKGLSIWSACKNNIFSNFSCMFLNIASNSEANIHCKYL